ncbi:sugar MFS transporter [uncultured Microscilla sp.]|uniref:sugar MFS transporter n=1 Tax=uncultured Microscilla sp. TaxID=432653 RepID=UPI00260E1CF9|nr:sugar MFS transporter [uncultured Microscilla sp.]
MQTTPTPAPNTRSSAAGKDYRQPFLVITFLFFMWGFITVMNDVLINSFEKIFQLSALQQSLIQLCFFGAFFIISLLYFLISARSGKDPVNQIGYKNGMAISLAISGVGCMSFYPAAQTASYGVFLLALFVLATGVTLLQVCANPYAALLGAPETASSRLNLAQGLNSLGTTVGPLIGVLLIFRVFSNGVATSVSVGKTYLLYGVIFLVLALVVRFTSLPLFRNSGKIEKGWGVLKFRHLRLGAIAIFFYVGAEVSVGSWLVKFLMLDHISGLSRESANYFLAYYWGGLMIGRLMGTVSLGKAKASTKYVTMALISLGVFAFIYLITGIKKDGGNITLQLLAFDNVGVFLIFLSLNYFAFLWGKSSPSRSLSIFSVIIIALLLIVILGTGKLAFWAVISIGLFNSIMWSNIFTMAIKDLGKYTSQGSSLLVMAIVGGAILPPLQSIIIDQGFIQLSFLVPLVSYFYILYYGVVGHKPKV